MTIKLGECIMKRFLSIILWGICLTVSANETNSCKNKFQSLKTKHLLAGKNGDVIGAATPVTGILGALLANPYGGAAAAGWQAFFAPMVLLAGVEGGIAIKNAPITKAIKLIDQSYAFKKNYYNKGRLLKRVARKLNMSPGDLAQTIIEANEDGSLCEDNRTKKDIMESIRIGDLNIVDVDEETYGGRELKWTCSAYPELDSREDYFRVDASHYGEDNKKRVAKRNAMRVCSEKTGKSCDLYTCVNNFTGEGIAYGGAFPF
jgi:hypothetical protein